MLHKVGLGTKSSDEHETTATTLSRDPISLLNARRQEKNSQRPGVLERAVTASISTPHDSLLAELQGQRPDVNTSAKIDAGSSALPTIPSLGSLERGPGAPSPTQGLRSAAATPNGSPEPIYDPFTGTLAYVLPAQSANDADSSHFEQAKDELWSQLGRIRELQSEIAVMHVQMEGVGQTDSRPKKGQGRTHSDTIVSEEWPDPAQIEQDQKKARDAEFESLTKAFEGRHAAIGKIMNKLDDLSKSLTAFHALPTPAMVFPSRNSTKDSSATIFSSPSPTYTSPASPSPLSPIDGSPSLPHATVPNNLQAEMAKIEIPRAESPESS